MNVEFIRTGIVDGEIVARGTEMDLHPTEAALQIRLGKCIKKEVKADGGRKRERPGGVS